MSTVLYHDHLPTTQSRRTCLPCSTQIRSFESRRSTPILVAPLVLGSLQDPEDAEAAAAKYNNNHFGPVGQKLSTCVTTEVDISPHATDLLTVFKHNLDNQIESCTVEITILPENHTVRNLNQLIEPVLEEFDMYVPGGDPYFDYEPDHIVHYGIREPGVALVQLAYPFMAKNVVHRFAGTYWKNATLNARCIPDDEMEALLAEQHVPGDGKDVMLFVTGIKAGTSTMEVRDIFKDYTLRDVNIPQGGKAFCFIFVRQDEANALLGQFGRGVPHGGRMIKVCVSERGKKKGTGGQVGAWSALKASPAVPSTDLKVNNLPYSVDDTTLRGVFKDFGVSKVIVKNGYAFVGVASSLAEQAVQAIHGRRIGDRVIGVKIAERCK